MFERILHKFGSTTDVRMFVLNMVCAGILCFALSLLYVFLKNYRFKAIRAAGGFAFLGLTMTLLATIFSSSLAIALGMVGAISFIRFRMASQDIEWLGFLLLSVAIGIGCGTGKLGIATFGFVFIALALLLRHWIFPKKARFISLSLTTHLQEPTNWANELRDKTPFCQLEFCKMEAKTAHWKWRLQAIDLHEIQALQSWLSIHPAILSFAIQTEEDGS